MVGGGGVGTAGGTNTGETVLVSYGKP